MFCVSPEDVERSESNISESNIHSQAVAIKELHEFLTIEEQQPPTEFFQ